MRFKELSAKEKVVREFNVTAETLKNLGKDGSYPPVFALVKLGSVYEIDFHYATPPGLILELNSFGSDENVILKLNY